MLVVAIILYLKFDRDASEEKLLSDSISASGKGKKNDDMQFTTGSGSANFRLNLEDLEDNQSLIPKKTLPG